MPKRSCPVSPPPVLVALKACERAGSKGEILRELARGEREISAGRGFSLGQVLAAAELLLERARK